MVFGSACFNLPRSFRHSAVWIWHTFQFAFFLNGLIFFRFSKWHPLLHEIAFISPTIEIFTILVGFIRFYSDSWCILMSPPPPPFVLYCKCREGHWGWSNMWLLSPARTTDAAAHTTRAERNKTPSSIFSQLNQHICFKDKQVLRCLFITRLTHQ